MDKIHFYDNGIRNALIDNFKLFSERNDTAIFRKILLFPKGRNNYSTFKEMRRFIIEEPTP